MPRRAIIVGVGAAIGAVIALFVATRFNLFSAAPRDATTTSTSRTTTSSSATSTSTTTSAPGSNAIGSNGAPLPPPEARPDLAEAFAASRFDDVRELCGSRETAAAHPYECTVAACKTHSPSQARTFFVGVADADRPKVQAECEAAHVRLDRPIRIPHRGKQVDLD